MPTQTRTQKQTPMSLGAGAVAGADVRPATPQDADALLVLMQALARFEGYADRFSVTAADLLARGLGRDDPQFHAWVAPQADGTLAGYVVARTALFTLDLRPTVTLKELYVSASARGQGVGSRLFDAVRDHATRMNASRMDWLVLPSNIAAKRLYLRWGGAVDVAWEHWQLPLG
jgi:ribosomal protein S18 acetylase RimI-like enzyme